MPRQRTVHACAALLLAVPCLVLAQQPALEPRTLVPTPTPTHALKDPRHVLQERQFLCGLFGSCRTTTIIEPGVAPTSSASSSAVDSVTSSSTSTAVSTSDTAPSTTSSTLSTSTESSSASSSSAAESSSSSSSSTPSESASASSTSSVTSSSASSLTQSIVTITSIVTNSDGSSSTVTSASSSAVAVPVQNNSKSGGLSGKTWGIIGGIVGGVAALVVGLFVFWKVAKHRSNNRAMDQIAWPELQNDATGGAFSTLNPQGTRRTGGAGFEMEKDRGEGQYYDEEDDEAGEIRGGGWASPGGLSPRLAYDPRMSGQFYGAGGGEGQYGYANEYGQAPMTHGQYYDPYRQEAPLPSLPAGAAGPARATSPHLPHYAGGGGPSSPRHPGALPYPGDPVHSFEMAAEPTYPPRSGRPYSGGMGGADDAYGGFAAGMSADDVPLTATAQAPASGGGPGPSAPFTGTAGQHYGYRY